ncbi:MAG: cyclic nucleotide-binding domain-containing protein [Magnetovibrio sp.]|nr:cyclic nucleotide-binding domain-containing protein [Magnetovibrio sp.]
MFDAERGIKKKFFGKGEAVFTEGDAGDMAYIIETGAIEIFKAMDGGEMRLAVMRDGELFGEMAIIDGSSRMANARAVEDTAVIQLPAAVVERKLASSEPFFKTLVQILVDNLRNVHRVYMRRPRSVEDYLNTVGFHTEGFRSYLESMNGEERAAAGLTQVAAVEGALAELRELFKGHRDRRHQALGEADVTRRAPSG